MGNIYGVTNITSKQLFVRSPPITPRCRSARPAKMPKMQSVENEAFVFADFALVSTYQFEKSATKLPFHFRDITWTG